MQHDRLERDPSLGQRLQKLPDERQPYGFAEFQRRARPGAGPRAFQGFRVPRLAVALAAAAVLAVVALSLLGQLPGAGSRGPGSGVTRPEPDPVLAAQAQTQAQAEAMEGWLGSLPAESAVVRVGSSAAVAGLEDRIALLDDVLSAERAAHAQPARLLAIEQQRGQLLRSLVQVRYAEDLAAGSR